MTIATDINEKGHQEVIQSLGNTVNSVLTITLERTQLAEFVSYATALVAIDQILYTTPAIADKDAELETLRSTMEKIKGIVSTVIPRKEPENGPVTTTDGDSESKAD